MDHLNIVIDDRPVMYFVYCWLLKWFSHEAIFVWLPENDQACMSLDLCLWLS